MLGWPVAKNDQNTLLTDSQEIELDSSVFYDEFRRL